MSILKIPIRHLFKPFIAGMLSLCLAGQSFGYEGPLLNQQRVIISAPAAAFQDQALSEAALWWMRVNPFQPVVKNLRTRVPVLLAASLVPSQVLQAASPKGAADGFLQVNLEIMAVVFSFSLFVMGLTLLDGWLLKKGWLQPKAAPFPAPAERLVLLQKFLDNPWHGLAIVSALAVAVVTFAISQGRPEVVWPHLDLRYDVFGMVIRLSLLEGMTLSAAAFGMIRDGKTLRTPRDLLYWKWTIPYLG